VDVNEVFNLPIYPPIFVNLRKKKTVSKLRKEVI
jgi:hypothetical protein